MASIVLTGPTIPDSKVARAKYLIEKFHFGGAAQTASVIKSFIEDKIKRDLRNEILHLDEIDRMQQSKGGWEPMEA